MLPDTVFRVGAGYLRHPPSFTSCLTMEHVVKEHVAGTPEQENVSTAFFPHYSYVGCEPVSHSDTSVVKPFSN